LSIIATIVLYLKFFNNDFRYDQAAVLQGILNDEGADGWELVQVLSGGNGIMAFWTRRQTVRH